MAVLLNEIRDCLKEMSVLLKEKRDCIEEILCRLKEIQNCLKEMNVLPIEIPIVLCGMNDCRTETNDCPKEIRVCLKINKRTSYRNALSPLGLAFNGGSTRRLGEGDKLSTISRLSKSKFPFNEPPKPGLRVAEVALNPPKGG